MNELPKRPLHVFLCHASDDKEKVRALYNSLIQQDIDVWFDEEKLLPGQHWQNEIPEALYTSDAVIVCLSKNVLTKEGYVQREIKYALDAEKEKPDGSVYLIPVKLEECDVPKQLNHLQWGNLFYKFGSFDEKDYEKLNRSLNARAVIVGTELPKAPPIKPKLDFRYDVYRPKPLLVVISGPSGAGKDAVLFKMKETEPDNHYVVTATTRPQRQGEVHGKDYFFLSKDEFANMIEQNDLIEYAIVYGDYKGIPKSQVRDAVSQGKDVVMRIDVQGAETIRKLAPEAVLIFLTTKNEDELINRLKARRTESPDSLSLRIATARKEMQRLEMFDYMVINEDGHLENAVNMIRAIIQVEHRRVGHRKIML